MLAQPPASTPAPEPQLELPDQIGPFEVLSELGRGGMAQVFRVRYRGHGFALKLLLHEAPDVRQRLDREAKLVGALEHPGIVRLQGAGRVDGRAFLLYDLIPEARPLSTAWATLRTEDRLELIAQIADAVGFAHTRGIVHRDLKPDNVLVDGTGRTRVIDFGLARQAGMERLTLSGVQLGTQAYMAPEQFAADPDQQRPAIDVWALGVLLYEALTERMPFHAEKVSELRGKLAGGGPTSPRAANPTISRALETVCLRALSTQQRDRQANGVVFASELRAAILRGPDRSLASHSRWLGAALVALALGGVGWGVVASTTAGETPGSEVTQAAPLALGRPFELIEGGEANATGVLEEARRRLALDPDDVEARVAEAAARVKLGDSQVAVELAEDVLAGQPSHLGALHALAAAYYAGRRYPECESACQRAQEVDPDVEFSWVYMSLLTCNQGDYERCIEISSLGLERFRDTAALWSARGIAWLGLNKLPRALEDLTAGLARKEDSRARLARAEVYLRFGRHAEALEDLEATQGESRESRAWTSIRIQCLLTLDRARAIKEGRVFQEQFPDRADANFFLGEALLRSGEFKEARTFLELAAGVEPGSTWTGAAARRLQELRR